MNINQPFLKALIVLLFALMFVGLYHPYTPGGKAQGAQPTATAAPREEKKSTPDPYKDCILIEITGKYYCPPQPPLTAYQTLVVPPSPPTTEPYPAPGN